MGIFLRQSHNVKPVRWGSPAEVQYSIWRNLEDIYGCNHESEVLIMPGFWGFPLLDYSKYGNHGTNYGATYKDGSLDFDGADYVDCGSNNLTPDIITVGAKVKINGDGGTNPNMIVNKQDAASGYRLAYDTVSNNFKFEIWDAGGQLSSADTLSISNGVFYDVVGIYDGKARIWLNGVEKTAGISRGTIGKPAINLHLGDYAASGGFNLNGLIDEVRISNVARTADQIALFHENPYGLYRRVARPVWSIPAAPSICIPQIIMF